MDPLLLDAKCLASRLREHNSSTDALIDQANNLYLKLDAMKQYHDVVSELNDVAHHRPRSTLILGSQEENARIRELQQDNIELQTSVAEYQSALELIMAKYREQVFGLIKANRLDATCMKLNNYKVCEFSIIISDLE
ncbi:FGFR1 oncogene partner 2 homolog [Acropora millepora]|uniref:FGFR1 oncogene partner 2 homolog n=1 Tax=Acropora millepora TaxID=45264 RepID=UPI001CF56534|nr:FGFR1 oncogene partner 2 homolog [Acropora millepora]